MGTSLPVFLGRGMHYLEAWNEAVADGAWGALASGAAERLRQGLDLEHWAAFGDSLRALERLLGDIASGRHGGPPGSVVLLSGDVHHAYIADARPTDGQPAWQAPVYQAVCSPLRNPLNSHEMRAIRLAMTSAAELVGRGLARAARVEGESLTWEIAEGPWFDNQLATLHLDGRHCTFHLEKALGGGDELPTLQQVAVRRLA
jgi:hypothetical protein